MSVHIGRGWPGNTSIEESCPCPQLACGLVDFEHANEIRCPQHWWGAAKTIRTTHDAEDCPARATVAAAIDAEKEKNRG